MITYICHNLIIYDIRIVYRRHVEYILSRTALANEIERQINLGEHTADFLCLIITVHYSDSPITINLLSKQYRFIFSLPQKNHDQ